MTQDQLKAFAQMILENALGMAPARKDIVLLEGSEDEEGPTYLLFRIGQIKAINYRIHRTNFIYGLEIQNTINDEDIFVNYQEVRP